MEKREFTEKTSVEDILGSFVSSYAERDRSVEFSQWLGYRLRREIPDMSEETCKELADEIIGAVADYDRRRRELDAAIDDGQSKEEWFAGYLAKKCEDMPLDVAGERLQQIEDDLIISNMQLIQKIDEGQAEAVEVSGADDDPVEWNEYSVKNKAYEIGNQIILTGIAAAANVLKEKEQRDEAVDISGIVVETFRDGLKNDSGEVRAVVAGAVRAAAEKGMADIVSQDTPTAVITDMAGVAVESAEALFDVVNGESTMTDAMDRMGRASVAAGCRYASDVLEGKVAKVPYVGPILVDLAGGLLEHMKAPKFTENVYNTVRDAAVATWEGVKKSRVGKAVRNLGKFVKKIFG